MPESAPQNSQPLFDVRVAGSAPPRPWSVLGRSVELAPRPWLMGIVNATPDSFSDGGKFLEPDSAVEQALRLVSEGAQIVDVGGESTRPGAAPVAAGDEIRRVIPVVEQIARQSNVFISIDTTKAEVARAALDAGAHIVNDISGLTFDREMPAVCAKSKAGVICTHIRGNPQSMQNDPRYGDVVAETCLFLEERLNDLERLGVARDSMVIDPGIGFGKTAAHNLEILGNIARFRGLGRPVCVGHSRKRFLENILERRLDERLFGTIGVAVAVALQGAEIIRVHDVAATLDAIVACRAVLEKTKIQDSGFGIQDSGN